MKFKPRNLAEATAPLRRARHVCRECPLWKPSYCSLLVVTRAADRSVCRYGAERINAVKTYARAKARTEGARR